MEDAEPQAQPAAGGTPPPGHQGLIKLPDFWTENPISWFCLAEGQFTLRNVTDPVTRYYHVLSSLSRDAVRLVRHMLYEETGPESHDNLRTSLLASHSLSNNQKMERMMKHPTLGDPSCRLCLPSRGVDHRHFYVPLPSAAAQGDLSAVVSG